MVAVCPLPRKGVEEQQLFNTHEIESSTGPATCRVSRWYLQEESDAD
jgi:hypothetical protein